MADAYWRYGDARHQAAAAAMAPPPATLKRPRAEYQCAYLPAPPADLVWLLRAFLFLYLLLRSVFVSCFPFLPIGFARFPLWQFASYLKRVYRDQSFWVSVRGIWAVILEVAVVIEARVL